MPGITGLLSFEHNNERLKPLLKRSIKSLSHHEWYKVEYLYLSYASVACIHTGILNQQVIFSHKGVHVVMHGEIYNDDLTSRNQAEYVAQCYRRDGSLFASKLNGSFALFLIDEKKRSAFLATDRVGSKPILFYHDDKKFFFAPEVKSFAALSCLNIQPDDNAVADVLSNGFITGRRSLVENIFYLDRASVCEISDRGVEINQYWTYTFDEGIQDFSIKKAKQELSGLLQKAVERRIRSTHNYAISLSGGYDSRAIVGYSLRAGKSVKCFSYSSSKKKFGDSAIAASVAEKAGYEHIHCLYDYTQYLNAIKRSAFLREGMGNVIEEWPIWETLRTDHNIDIILTGEECFGWQDVYIDSEEAMFKTLGIYSLKNFPLYSKILTPEAYNKLNSLLQENMKRLSSQCPLQDFHNRKDYFYLDQRLFSLLIWRYAISTEVEVRNPWLDNDILDFMMKVPIQYRRGKRLFKDTVISFFPELFTPHIARASDALSPDDFEQWRYEYKSGIEKELFDRQSPVDTLFNTDALNLFLWHNKSTNKNERSLFALVKQKLLETIMDSHPSFYSFVKKLYNLYKWAPLTVSHEDMTLTKMITRIIMLRLAFQHWSSKSLRN